MEKSTMRITGKQWKIASSVRENNGEPFASQGFKPVPYKNAFICMDTTCNPLFEYELPPNSAR
jgi:hypothetical protein